MRVHHPAGHGSHAPRRFIVRGEFRPCPETPRRAEVLLDAVRSEHEIRDAPPADPDALARVHAGEYLEFLREAWAAWSRLEDGGEEIVPNVHPGRRMAGRPQSIVGRAGYYQADAACPIGAGTWDGVIASAGAAVAATADVLGGERHAYALCRPPGHHAYADLAGGFCYLNNTAIAVEHARAGGAARVAVVDVDVHHGNGTQGIFYERPDVLTVSLHADPDLFYPFFAGYAEEIGAGPGRGLNHNVPLPRGTGDEAYAACLEDVLERVTRFAPEILVVALGLDASERDPLAFLAITTDGFRRIGATLGALGAPTVLVQEGGYLSPVLGDNLAAALVGFESARAR